MNYIVLAIPVFLLLILLELVITRLQEKDYYRLTDSISDLGCGILQQLLEVFAKTAGTLIVWDRLFGSYQAEEEEPVYGITTPLSSWNPVWANFHYWAVLLANARRTRRLPDKIRIFLKPPGWQPAELGGFVPPPEVDRPRYRKFDTPLTGRRALYVFLHFAAVLAVSAGLLYSQGRVPFGVLLGGAGFVLLSLVALSGLIERRPWAPALDAARLLAALLAAATFSWL